MSLLFVLIGTMPILLLLFWTYCQLSRQLTALYDETVLLKQVVTVLPTEAPSRTPEPPPHSWVGTDALQAAQEQSQMKRMAKIANSVRWG